MPRDFTLPDLGEGLTEAEIVKVLVREGDAQVLGPDRPEHGRDSINHPRDDSCRGGADRR